MLLIIIQSLNSFAQLAIHAIFVNNCKKEYSAVYFLCNLFIKALFPACVYVNLDVFLESTSWSIKRYRDSKRKGKSCIITAKA